VTAEERVTRMTRTERITAKNGVVLDVEKALDEGGAVELVIRMENCRKKCYLHWGLRSTARGPWQLPPSSVWPEESRPLDHAAVQTPFPVRNGISRITIRLAGIAGFSSLDFALYFPDEDRWDNNGGLNYRISMDLGAGPDVDPAEVLRQEVQGAEVSFEHVFVLDDGSRLATSVTSEKGRSRLRLLTRLPGSPVMHWGVAARSRHDWALPPVSLHPPGTTLAGDRAAETPFMEKDGLKRVEVEIGDEHAVPGIAFVIKQADTGRWFKDGGRDFFIPVHEAPGHEIPWSGGAGQLAAVAEEIIEKEMSRGSWTLMHRFNLCHDLLDRVRNDPEGLALIFVWLRFSALRQLDWQRNFNTKPRELAHAMDRLTLKLGDFNARYPEARELIRLIMATLGRGGDGQRVRDEVLNIMHRHHIKEVSGHFMEEWHQKLHNNTTPDDVVICEAFLEFQRSNGNLDRFYQKLKEGGVTRERMESFERPIRSHPDFIPHLKDALIHDFENFLGTLKAVHSGTDLGTAIHGARYLMDGEMHGLMDFIWAHRNDGRLPATELIGKITLGRRLLADRLQQNGAAVRDLLFLDLALEDYMRVVVERSVGAGSSRDALTDLIRMVVANLALSKSDDELGRCLHQWERLAGMDRSSIEWPLHAKAVVDRLGRVLSGFTDRFHTLLQPKARYLGEAFHADSWTIDLFSEEVMRGRLEFALSILLRHLDPILRRSARLGDWQVVSPGGATGRVEVVDSLISVQGKDFEQPTVLLAGKVAGNEEIPLSVKAVLTQDTTDIVSHVAIRARNAGLLFATCFDPETFNRLKSLAGRVLKLSAGAAHDVVFEELVEGPASTVSTASIERGGEKVQIGALSTRKPMSSPVFTAYAVSSGEFNEKNVGGKSNNLMRLRSKVPEWIRLLTSVALPFGVFERVLSQPNNREVAERYEGLTRQLVSQKTEEMPSLLADLRKAILDLDAPDGLTSDLRSVMESSGLDWPAKWGDTWISIKRVWASKWNERATLSRKAYGIAHEDLFMAVLIQQVVEAEYSYVIHTVNPFTKDRGELYAELTLGLGETLVGNYPGRAMSFTFAKDREETRVLAFPSKSVGLYGGGLIFRSDSNGEDLAGYAGAGLYDSFMLAPARTVSLDYSKERLLWDEGFRQSILTTIGRIGVAVERTMGSPQDIEGAFDAGHAYVVQTRPQVGI
jgi:alpha-glucan, water dikinase